jgi:hypothetical protein
MAKLNQKEMTRLQGAMAIASFVAGVIIACLCLFLVPPPREISNSAISIVSELLVLAGAILGVKTSYDAKFIKIESDLRRKADKSEYDG